MATERAAVMEWMVEDYAPLFWGIAKRYRGRGLAPEDLEQWARIGWLKAVRVAASGRPWRPHSWVRAMVVAAIIKEGAVIRTPEWAYKLVGRWRRHERELRRPVPPEEAAELLGIKAEAMDLVASAASVRRDNEQEAVDEPYSVDRGYESSDLRDWVDHCLGRLPERQARVLRMRFGIGEPERTLKEVAAALGLSIEGVRKIEGKALDALRGLEVGGEG